MVKSLKLFLMTVIMIFLIIPVNVALGYHAPITVPNPTPVSGDGFGFSVSIDGNNALVGAYGNDVTTTNDGSAYLFDATTGSLLRTFNNPDPGFNDSFGFVVSISGNLVLVSAPLDDTGVTNAGAAYLFDATTGSLLRTFNNPAPASNDYFGYSASIDGTRIIIGAFLDDTRATDAGSAYLFDATTGTLLQTFTSPAPGVGDQFGRSVSIDSSKVLVGAFLDDAGATDAGSAYLFNATTGTLLQTFTNPAPYLGDQFGRSVSISGNNILVGTDLDDAGATDAGSAYLFDATTGSLLRTFNNPAPASGDSFGESVSIDSSKVLVGAFLDDAGATDAGSAYLLLENIGSSGQAQGQTQILGTCGLSFPNGNNVNYGSLTQNTISAEKNLNMTNSGSVNAALTVKGGDWKDSGSNSVMLANRTHYNVTSGITYSQKTSLQTFDQLVKNPFVPSVILQTFWQLQAILMNPSFTGSATQTMNFTVSC